MHVVIATLSIGFVTSLTLIVAIGAQNAFVLRQGIRREHVLPVVLVCAAADAVLIATGIGGLGALVTSHPRAMDVVRLGGAAFLLGYGLLAAVRALRPSGMVPSERAPGTIRAALLTCLGFTFLNPHVYLDTVVMLGSLANQHGAEGRWAFGVGAIAASFSWFFALGFGAHRLARFFENPRSWRWLDGTIAVVMIAMGLGLVLGSG